MTINRKSKKIREELDKKQGRKVVTIGKTTTGEDISNRDKKKNNWILGRI